MNILNKNKFPYSSPIIGIVKLDNEIALQLQSVSPPEGPNETSNIAPEYFNNDPLKPNFG